MRAFHNNPGIKKFYIDRIKRHMKMDNLIQGTGWKNGKGCAIGCQFENYDHRKMVEEWDVPLVLAKLEDRIFEELSTNDAMEWPLRFTKSLKVGVDYSMVWPKFAVCLLERVKNYSKDKRVLEAINKVLFLYYDWFATGKKPRLSRWHNAATAVDYVHDYFAAANAFADTTNADHAVADHAVVEYAAASPYARKDEWKWIANTLIEVINGEK